MLNLNDLDAAVSANMAHGAMSGADPLTDSLYGQLDCCACEGALPACTAGAGLTPSQRQALAIADDMGPPLWLVATVAVLAIAASAPWPWGVA